MMIERRELLMAGAGLAAAGTLAVPGGAAASNGRDGDVDDGLHRRLRGFAPHVPGNRRLADEARRRVSYGVADRHAERLCGTVPGDRQLDAAESALHRIVCRACADACERCAEECGRHSADQRIARCSATCKKCAASCRTMADMSS
jgi:hypothetical protein